jgi:putative transcriptional regulator
VIVVRLEELLLQRKKTRYWLAKRAKLSQATISKLFKRQRTGIDFTTLNAICKAFECQPSEFLVYVNDEEKEEIEQKNKSEKAS